MDLVVFYEVMVEKEDFAFPISIEYEGLPKFYTHCKSTGHNVTFCRWLRPRAAENNEQLLDKSKKLVHS